MNSGCPSRQYIAYSSLFKAAKSVVLTPRGFAESERLLEALFPARAAAPRNEQSNYTQNATRKGVRSRQGNGDRHPRQRRCAPPIAHTSRSLNEARRIAKAVLYAAHGLYTEVDICQDDGRIESILTSRRLAP